MCIRDSIVGGGTAAVGCRTRLARAGAGDHCAVIYIERARAHFNAHIAGRDFRAAVQDVYKRQGGYDRAWRVEPESAAFARAYAREYHAFG